MAQTISEPNLFPYNTPKMPPAELILHAPTCLWRWNSVPKRRYLLFRLRGITHKKAYNIRKRAKVWNQEKRKFVTYDRKVYSARWSFCTEPFT